MTALARAIEDVPHLLWDGTGDNPYFAFLALADAIVVTADSVNMVTEAAGTGKPVYVQALPGRSTRLARFHRLMQERGATRPFEGRLEFVELRADQRHRNGRRSPSAARFTLKPKGKSPLTSGVACGSEALRLPLVLRFEVRGEFPWPPATPNSSSSARGRPATPRASTPRAPC